MATYPKGSHIWGRAAAPHFDDVVNTHPDASSCAGALVPQAAFEPLSAASVPQRGPGVLGVPAGVPSLPLPDGGTSDGDTMTHDGSDDAELDVAEHPDEWSNEEAAHTCMPNAALSSFYMCAPELDGTTAIAMTYSAAILCGHTKKSPRAATAQMGLTSRVKHCGQAYNN